MLSNFQPALAATLSGGSLELSDSRINETSDYAFSAGGFTTATAIACVELSLNTQADGLGTVPGGLTTTSSTYDASTLLSDGNWSVDNTTNGVLRLTNSVTTEAPAASGNIVWGGVVNGSVAETAYFGLLTTYTDNACTGGNEVDAITLAFTYTNGALVSLDIGSQLLFECVGVGSGQTVNNATTTVGTSSTLIDFGTMTSAANNVSAHDLEVTTNAAGGYVVYIRQSGNLASGGSTIAWTASPGSNSTPVAFPLAGTEAWGYTTDDATLSGGTPDRFTSGGGNKWAAFNTVNEEVFYSTTATAGTETQRVGHQVGIAPSTDAGTYQTTIIYTIVAVY